MLRDRFGRIFKTLRVSVTDRCNLRCQYCMPAQGVKFLETQRLMTGEELARALRLLVGLGIESLKFTGGEPLLRNDLEELIGSLRGLAGLREMSLTTNGLLLKQRAASLAKAGLHRVTVSVDSLDAASFEGITRGGRLAHVLEGIQEAQRQGLTPIKINVVVMNQKVQELLALGALSLFYPWEIRFIEYMPVSSPLGAQKPEGLNPKQVRWELEEAYGPLEALASEDPAAPAVSFRFAGAKGRIGFISSVSAPFCSRCDRLRLQADGYLRLCMAQPDGFSLTQAMRQGQSDAELERSIQEAVYRKPAGHQFYQAGEGKEEAFMWRIGG